MARPNMPRTLPDKGSISELESASGQVQVDAQTPDAATNPDKSRHHIEAFYEAGRNAIKLWGGSASLSSLWGMAESNVSARLNRREVNGSLAYAFRDWDAIATTNAAAAESYLYALCDLFGFERPKRKREKTVEEKHRALVEALRKCGPLGEAAIKRAAADLGADPSEFDL